MSVLFEFSVTELRRNDADLVYVNSTDHRIIMAIANLNTTPTLHLNDVDQGTVENLVAPEKYFPCQKVHPKQNLVQAEACSAVTFEKNYFHEETITLMVTRTLAHLQWQSMFLFFENSSGKFTQIVTLH
jgi:hypothetical protein